MDVLHQAANYLTTPAIITWAVTMVAAICWPIYQNSGNRLGGEIGIWKSFWLFYAITLWVVMPWFFISQHAWWWAPAISMALRSVVELILCSVKRWKTSHGITHDVIHLILMVLMIMLVPSASLPWIALTIVSLICEIHFVFCFKSSGGKPEDGIYFVPEGEEFQWVHNRTRLLLLPQLTIITFMIIIAVYRSC